MKTVLFDTSPLSSGHSLRGVGYYTKKLKEYFLKFPKITESSGLKIIFSDENFSKEKINLIHYPFFDPFFLSLPLFKKTKTVVTVHDLIPLIFPDKYPKGIRGLIKWQIQKLSLLGCQAIITDSQNSKNDTERIIGFKKTKIYPVYLSADEQFKKLSPGDWEEDFKKRFGLKESSFLLYVGDVNYNKNIPGLLQAFKTLKSQNNDESVVSDLKLVLIGKAFEDLNLKESRDIEILIKEYKLENEIIRPGHIQDKELVRFYNLAAFYIQPSFYEGFGLPVLEAMACGCPVICSDKSSLPEIAGDACYYIDPRKQEAIIKAIKELVVNKALREKMIKKGLGQSKKFSWEKTLNETISVYKKMLS